MKKLFKSIIAAMLCAVIAITALGVDTAQAASNATIKITLNKKTVKTSLTDVGIKEIKYKTMKKKWGKPSYSDKGTAFDCKYAQYAWKKGKTEVLYTWYENSPTRTAYNISIGDKNGALCGIKVGMKADKAKKLLEKFDADISEDKGSIFAVFNGNDLTNIKITLKNGKVSSISGVFYVGE